MSSSATRRQRSNSLWEVRIRRCRGRRIIGIFNYARGCLVIRSTIESVSYNTWLNVFVSYLDNWLVSDRVGSVCWRVGFGMLVLS